MYLHYKFEYSDAGNLISKIDGNNAKTEYNYDSVGRLNAVKHNNAKVAEFQHDANGNIISAENQNAEASFAYDEMNRLVSSTQTVGSVSAVVKNSYDANGNRTAWTLGDLTVQYNYGADNRLENVTTKNSNGTKSFSFGYDSTNRLTTLKYPNGVNSSFSYDYENRVVSIQHGNFVNRQIERNPLGFKTEEKINVGISPKPPKNERRLKTYNDADQLVSEKIQTATTNWSNVAYAYNANGGMERITTEDTEDTEFSYDYNNLISSVTSASSVVEYLHDASGARIGRIENGVKTYFVIDYLDGLKRPLAEFTVQNSALIISRYYIWNGSQLLAHIESNGDIRYYHADELGSTLALTDKNGIVTDEFAYMPYGYATHSGVTETPYLWLGGYGVYYDSETDLHLTLHRAYSSSQKRFISPDPLGVDAFANIYAYGDLNPLAFIDPEGLATYELNSALGGSGEPKHLGNIFSHTLQYTTHPNGSLKHTYSWAPNGNAMIWNKNKGDWIIDNDIDKKAANYDINNNKTYSKKIGNDSYDNYLNYEIRRRQKTKEDKHHWYLWDNCKTQLNEVDVVVKNLMNPSPFDPFSSTSSKNQVSQITYHK